MSLADLIRKGATAKPANAKVANPANDEQGNTQPLARLATLALANPPEVKSEPSQLAEEDESIIRRWLAHIGEIDSEIIAKVFEQCRTAADARAYFLAWAVAIAKPADSRLASDQRTCNQCANLTGGGICLAARSGEVIASRNYEPMRDVPRRCEGYGPKIDESDRRKGRERWPGLNHKHTKAETWQ